MPSLLQRGLYAAIVAAILWGGTLFFRNVAKAFRGNSTKRFCLISAVITGLLGAFLIIMMIINQKMYGNIFIFALIILLFALVMAKLANSQNDQKNKGARIN